MKPTAAAAAAVTLMMLASLQDVSAQGGRGGRRGPPRKGPAKDKPLPSKPVKDAFDAEMYLEHFGYLYTPPNTDNAIRLRDQTDVVSALLAFQSLAHIPETGILDNKTIELMNTPRCGVRDMTGTSGRAKRYAQHGTKWPMNAVTWRLTKPTTKLTLSEQRTTIQEALNYWARVTPLTFNELRSGTPDIEVRFERSDHGDGSPFDGPYGTLAHAYFPYNGQQGLAGDCHFDDVEQWTIDVSQGVNMLSVAVHEFGHSLGLLHSDVSGSIMWPFSMGYDPNLKLHRDDIDGIQAVYGKPDIAEGGRTTTRRPTTPTTRRPPTTTTRRPTPPPSNPLDCSGYLDAVTTSGDGQTYAFRGQYVFTLDSSYHFTNPRKITEVFSGTPRGFIAKAAFSTNVVAAGEEMYLYLIRGTRVWRYNKALQLSSGYPRSTSAEFNLPRVALDAAFVWGRNGKLYFFRGGAYWRYSSTPSSGYPRSTTVWGSDLTNLDAAMTWINGRAYFFKGDNYYRYNDDDFSVDKNYPRATAPTWFGCTPSQLQATDDADSADAGGATGGTSARDNSNTYKGVVGG